MSVGRSIVETNSEQGRSIFQEFAFRCADLGDHPAHPSLNSVEQFHDLDQPDHCIFRNVAANGYISLRTGLGARIKPAHQGRWNDHGAGSIGRAIVRREGSNV